MISVRDRWLLAVLPAIITAAVFLYGPLSTAGTKLTRTRTELQAEKAKPLDLRAMNALSNEYEDNQAALTRAKLRLVVLNAPPANRLGPPSADRSASIRTVSSILDKHGLVLARSEKIEAETENLLGKRTLDMWRAYAERTQAHAPQLWRFELRGSYPRITEAAESLAHSPQFIVPLLVTMEPPVTLKLDATQLDTETSGHRLPAKGPERLGGWKWTLTLWL